MRDYALVINCYKLKTTHIIISHFLLVRVPSMAYAGLCFMITHKLHAMMVSSANWMREGSMINSHGCWRILFLRGSLVPWWNQAALGSLTNEPLQHVSLFHQCQQRRVPAGKTVTTLCIQIAEVISHRLNCILLVKSKSLG